MKVYYLFAALALVINVNAHAQEKPKGLIVDVYGKKGVFKKDEFLACEKTYDDDMKNKCKEVEGKVNMDISVVEEGGCFDQVAQARDMCEGKAFVGNVGEDAVAGYQTEVYEKKEPTKKQGSSESKSKSDDSLFD